MAGQHCTALQLHRGTDNTMVKQQDRFLWTVVSQYMCGDHLLDSHMDIYYNDSNIPFYCPLALK